MGEVGIDEIFPGNYKNTAVPTRTKFIRLEIDVAFATCVQ